MSGTYQHKEGKGSVRPNQFKTDDRHPDLKGDGMFNGVVFDIAMWQRDNGGYSVSISPKRQPNADAPAPAPAPARAAGGGSRLDDDIPFTACKE